MNVNEECFEQMILWALENPYSLDSSQGNMLAACQENWKLLSNKSKETIARKVRSNRSTNPNNSYNWEALVERWQAEQLATLKPTEFPTPKMFVVHSRAAVPRMVSLVDPARGVFLVSGSSSYYRAGEGMYDFEGGPMLEVGEEFYGWGTINALKPVHKDDLSLHTKLSVEKMTELYNSAFSLKAELYSSVIRNWLNGGPRESAVLVSVDYSEGGLLKIEDLTLTSAPDGAL